MKTLRVMGSVFGVALVLTGCQTTTQSGQSDARAATGSKPDPLRIVGEAASGKALARAFADDGFTVSSALNGRSEGLKEFCSGKAEVLALSSDLSDVERSTCKSLGGDWSAGSAEGGQIAYVSYFWSENIFTQSSVF